MTSAPRITAQTPQAQRSGDVLLGEDWVSPDSTVERLKERRAGRGFVTLKGSPLARKIIIFNLLALVILVVGVLFMNPFRESLALQRHQGMTRQVELIADIYESRLLPGPQGFDFRETLAEIEIDPWFEVFVFDPTGRIIASKVGQGNKTLLTDPGQTTLLTDFLENVWNAVTFVLRQGQATKTETIDVAQQAASVFEAARIGETVSQTGKDQDGSLFFSTGTPITVSGDIVGVVVLVSSSVEIDRLVRYEREQILRMFVVAVVLSIALSLMLASTISNPLSDLAAAAELGRERDTRRNGARPGAHPRPCRAA
jgi:two-component system sensor histidine kinase ChvG